MNADVDWDEVRALLDQLYAASERLEALFEGRKFTLDGHLVGSIGEVIAAAMFDLKLNIASTKGHDALAIDGRRVEVKLTQGNKVALRDEPDHLIVLHRPKGGPLTVIYNGPGQAPWESAGKMADNGQRRVGISTLRRLNKDVSEQDRLEVIRSVRL